MLLVMINAQKLHHSKKTHKWKTPSPRHCHDGNNNIRGIILHMPTCWTKTKFILKQRASLMRWTKSTNWTWKMTPPLLLVVKMEMTT